MKKSFALFLALLTVVTGCGSKEQFSNERAYRTAIDLDVAGAYEDILNDPIAYASEPSPNKEDIYKMISDAFFMINDYRAAQNLEPFVWSHMLSERAYFRAEEASAVFDVLTRPSGESWDTISPYDVFAESLYKSKKADINAIKSWMGNEPDKANFFNKDYTTLGIGVFINAKGECTFAALFGSDTIDVTFSTNFDFDNANILKDTEDNRSNASDDPDMIFLGANTQKYNLRIPKADDENYILRMTDNDDKVYEADISGLKSGSQLNLKRSLDGNKLTLIISDKNNEIVDEIEVAAVNS